MCRWKVASTTCSRGRPHDPTGRDDDHHANHYGEERDHRADDRDQRDDDHDHPAQHVAILTTRTSTHQEILNMIEHQYLQ